MAVFNQVCHKSLARALLANLHFRHAQLSCAPSPFRFLPPIALLVNTRPINTSKASPLSLITVACPSRPSFLLIRTSPCPPRFPNPQFAFSYSPAVAPYDSICSGSYHEHCVERRITSAGAAIACCGALTAVGRPENCRPTHNTVDISVRPPPT